MAEADWLRLQKKIFTRYVNQKFRGQGSQTKVTDILKDVKDGLVIIELVEIMSGKSFGDKKPKPATQRIQQIDNASKAIAFLKSCGVNTQASAEDLVDGKEKLVFGTIFQIIVKYMKLDDEDAGSSNDIKEAMLLWLRNKTAGYNNVNIENFTKSFHDGLAFCALIHKMRPKLIPFDQLNKDDKIKNLTLALDTAAKYCNVEKYLEPTDIAKLDELSMIVYLSDWYYGVSLLQQQDIGARRIGKLIVMTQLHDKMRAEYTNRSKALVAWIDAKIKELDDHTFDNTLEGIRKKLAQFYDYKANAKGEKISEHMDIESLFNDLALRLQRNKRPPFQPPQGTSLADLQAKLKALEASENNRSAAMQKELARQIKLDKWSKRYAADAQKFLGWVSEKEQYLKVKEDVDSIASAQLHLNVLASYNREYENVRGSRLAALKALANDIIADNYIHKNDIAAKQSDAEAKFGALAPLAQSKDKVLQDDLAREKHKEKLRMDFSVVATDFDSIARDEIETAGNSYFGDTLEDVQAYEKVLSAKEAEVKAKADEKKKNYDAVWAELQQYKVTENKYTKLTLNDLVALRAKLDEALDKQRKAYQAELARQIANDKLCKEFADKAQAFIDNLGRKKLSADTKSEDLEAALKNVNGLLNENVSAQLDELDALEKKIRDAEIASNKYTQLTANDARTSQAQFLVSLNKRKSLLEAELENQKRSGLTPDQMKEIEDNFKHFDKDNSKFLDRREFRLCLQSLGQDSTPKAVDAALSVYDKDKNGKISFDEFIDFMKKRLGDTNTKEEILDAFFLINQKDYADMELMRAVVNDTTFKEEYVKYLEKEAKKEGPGYNYKQWTEEVFAR